MLPKRVIFRELALVLFVVVSAILVLRGPAVSQGFTIDESRWISTSRYFWITFIQRDLFGPDWQPNYIVFTHPPVGRYLIGYGLWLQGWSPEQLNGRYDSLQNRAYNDRAGNIPEPELLAAARQVTFVFGVISVAVIYGIGRVLGGPVAGLAAAGLTLVNPLLTTLWTRALAESIVAAFGLTTLLLALIVLPRVSHLGRFTWTPLLVGVALALATGAKLNGAIGAVGLVLYMAVQQGLALAVTRRTAGFRSWVDVGLAAVILFVALNPLLYLHPFERIVSLVQHRQDEMQFQRMVFSDHAVPTNLGARIGRVGWRAFDTWATPTAGLPISPDAILVPVGLTLLVWQAVRDLRRRHAGPVLLFLSWTFATYAIVTANLGYDSSHYYAPLVSLNMVCGGLALGAGARAGWRIVRARRRGQPAALLIDPAAKQVQR